MSDLPEEATRFIEAVTAHFGAPEAVTFRNANPRRDIMTAKAFDDKNTGVLFKNEDKQSEKHADYSGSVNAAGLDYWVDGWVRQAKSGKKFISFKLKLKVQQRFDVKEPPVFNDEIGL